MVRSDSPIRHAAPFAATLIAAAMLGELAPPSAYAQFVWIGSLLVFTTVFGVMILATTDAKRMGQFALRVTRGEFRCSQAW